MSERDLVIKALRDYDYQFISDIKDGNEPQLDNDMIEGLITDIQSYFSEFKSALESLDRDEIKSDLSDKYWNNARRQAENQLDFDAFDSEADYNEAFEELAATIQADLVTDEDLEEEIKSRVEEILS